LTSDIALILGIVGITFLLLVTERLRVDLIALLVLIILVASGIITPTQALSGFSSPAVITVWAVFILSGGLTRSGIARSIGRMVLRFAGDGEARLVGVIMLGAGLLSAFLNNVGVVALLLPVVMDITRRTGYAPSRLLIPLAYGALLGGLTTMIGTPANILVNDAVQAIGLPPFQLFDFTPIGLCLMLIGIVFMMFIGRHLLPHRDVSLEITGKDRTEKDIFGVDERLFVLRLPAKSDLDGKTLLESRMGAALGLNILAILREREQLLAPGPQTYLSSEDRLIVEGRPDRLVDLQHRRLLSMENDEIAIDSLESTEIHLWEITIAPESEFIGETLFRSGFRGRYGANVLAIMHNQSAQRTNLQEKVLHAGDTLLIQASEVQVNLLKEHKQWIEVQPISTQSVIAKYKLDERVRGMRIPSGSSLIGLDLAESRLADAFGISVLAIHRGGTTKLLPETSERLEQDDFLIVEVWPEDLKVLNALIKLEMELGNLPELKELQTDLIGSIEVVLSPHSSLAGRSLRDLHFREKYDLSVLAIWRGGRAYRSGLRDMPLRFGDALLLYGPRSALRVLGEETDFLVLTEEVQQPPRIEKAPVALAIMAGVISLVVLNIFPIAIAAVIGATLMVLFQVITMDEAYRFINWPVVFLIAGMLPLGIALQDSGTAQYLAEAAIKLVGTFGPNAIITALFMITALISQIMPNAAVTVVMAPIALSTAVQLNLSPYSLAIITAISASSSFVTPVAHPTNSLIMGAGGYRFSDYFKAGSVLLLLLLGTTLLLLPVLWPLGA
jgi:di/tricarboxylate transporter